MSRDISQDVADAVELVTRRLVDLRYKHDRAFIEALRLVNEVAQQTVEMNIMAAIPPDKRMEHMTEPELSTHLTRQLRFIKASQSEDTIGSMLIIFQEDGITQYGSTVHPENVPQALRELADRLEARDTVERN